MAKLTNDSNNQMYKVMYTINYIHNSCMTLKMISAQVVETSVNANDNSSFQNYMYMLWCIFVLGANFIFLCFWGMVMYDNV